MKNLNVIENFIKGNTKGKTANLYIVGNKLLNYNTVIAIRKDSKIILNSTKYSQTTSRIQNMIRNYCPSMLLVEMEEKQLYNIA